MDSSTPDDAETSEVAELPDAVVPDAVVPDAVVPDAVGAETEGTLLPLGTVAKVVGERGGTVGEGLNDGVFKTPAIISGIEDPEAVEILGLAGSGVPGSGEADPEVDGNGGDEPDGELAGGELPETDTEGRDAVDPDGEVITRTGSEADDPDVGVETEIGGLPDGLFEDEVDGDEDDPVDGEVEGNVDELLVVTLTDPTVGLELEELPVGELIDEEELLVLKLTVGEMLDEDEVGLAIGGVVEETEGLELVGLGLGLDEVVGVVLVELEVLVVPQPGIVVKTVAQKVSLSFSVQESDDPTHELLLAVTGGVVGGVVGAALEELVVVVIPHPGIGVYMVEQKVSESNSVQDRVDPRHELLLAAAGGVVTTQRGLLTVVVRHV
jgi:hypothetical protein